MNTRVEIWDAAAWERYATEAEPAFADIDPATLNMSAEGARSVPALVVASVRRDGGGRNAGDAAVGNRYVARYAALRLQRRFTGCGTRTRRG